MSHNRIYIEGSLASGAETWSTSFAVQSSGGAGVATQADLTTWAEACRTAFSAGTGWPGDLRAMIGSTSSIDRVRIYFYNSPSAPASALGQSTGAAVSGSGTVLLPLQSALVYTLQTVTPGRSYRGRMYWPFLTASMNTNGKINTASTSLASRASSFASMLDALCDAGPALSLRPAIVSKTTGAVTQVTSVRVGDVIDTQRRRRDNLVESFGSAVVP